jgi:hypothetical protein
MPKSRTKKYISMTKYIVAALVLFAVFFVVGCRNTETEEDYNSFNRFVVVKGFQTSIRPGQFSLIKDTETGVLYLMYTAGHRQSMTVLLDADGKPLTDKE